jgi:polyisoprenoid-binding protein YceI
MIRFPRFRKTPVIHALTVWGLVTIWVQLGTLPSAQSGTYSLDPTTPPRVEFVAIGRPSALKIKGSGNELMLAITLEKDLLRGKVEFSLASLDTGLSLRDRHMKEKYLEVEKFPKSTFEILEGTLPADLISNEVAEAEVILKGKLTLHGVTRDLTTAAKVKKKGTTYEIQAPLEVKLPDFQIEIPKFAGITVAEDVKIDIRFQALTTP